MSELPIYLKPYVRYSDEEWIARLAEKQELANKILAKLQERQRADDRPAA